MRDPYNRPLHPRHLRPAGREKTEGQLTRRLRDGAPVPRPELPGRQAVEGRLVLAPRKDFEGQAVRLKLVRQEVVPRNEGNLDEPIEAKETVAESPRFWSGISQEYAVGITVPEKLACPCLQRHSQLLSR
jgi:hypothetical protein